LRDFKGMLVDKDGWQIKIAPSPQPSGCAPRLEGEGIKSGDFADGTISSPLPLGEDLGEGAREAIPAHMIKLAKNLRKNQTDAENLMWQLLRNRQIANAKFRRQHPIEGYIADFYCHEYKLVVELDGSQHLTVEGMQKDAARTYRLKELGVTVVRFDNRQILQETEAVLRVIYEKLKCPRPNPLPAGEGLRAPTL